MPSRGKMIPSGTKIMPSRKALHKPKRNNPQILSRKILYTNRFPVINHPDSSPTLVQGQRNPYEIVTAEIYPRLADQARLDWGLENNIFNLGTRGYVATPGGVKENPYTFIKDLAAGRYKLPWEDEIKIKDGSIYGYPATNKLAKN